MNQVRLGGVSLQPASCASTHSKTPAAKRPRDSKTPADSRKGASKKQKQVSSLLANIPGVNGGPESSLLLCLHALTHCTEQLKRQVASSSEEVQLLSDIATSAGRLQRVARQQLQLLQTSTADAALQQGTKQHGPQHDMSTKMQDVVVQVGVAHLPAAVRAKQQKQPQQVASDRNTVKQPANKTIVGQPQQQGLQQQQQPAQPVVVKVEPLEHGQDLSRHQRQLQHHQQQPQMQAKVRLPPAPTANKLPSSKASQHAAAAAWKVDKQPFSLHQNQHAASVAANTAETHWPRIQGSSSPSRAAAALEAALAAAAAEADAPFTAIAGNSSRMADGSDHQHHLHHLLQNPCGGTAASGPPAAVHLPALKPVTHLPRDRLKHLAVAVGAKSGAASVAGAAGRVNEVLGVKDHVAADHNAVKARPTAAGKATYASAGASTYISSEDSGFSSCSSDTSSRSCSSSSDNTDADSDADLPLTQLQEKHTPKTQDHKQQQQPTGNTAPPTACQPAVAQHCLVCRKVFAADRLVSSKLFCSCQPCLTAAVQSGSRRGYRLAQCPKRGCDAMVIKLGKSGWHTGSSGQAHYVDIDSKTGLFRIGYTKKSSKSRKRPKKGVGKGRSSMGSSTARGLKSTRQL